MRYLLDTHIWVWMHSFPEELSDAVVGVFGGLSGEDELLLSDISLWEVCKLVERGRLNLFRDLEEWVASALDVPFLRRVPLDFDVFRRSTTLPQPFHRDPADQMIVASARIADAVVLTKDRLILGYPHVKSLW